MFIAFEGPDEVGKSTAAAALASDRVAVYNVTKELHEILRERLEGQDDLVVTYDRIDWLTHMIYRLALPEKEWNDPRVRTVFAMPDTHLVLRLHRPDLAASIEAVGEGYAPGRLTSVNELYWQYTDWLMDLNRHREYALFKSITIVEVENTPEGYSMRLADHDSPGMTYGSAYAGAVDTNDRLLGFLRHVDQHIG